MKVHLLSQEEYNKLHKLVFSKASRTVVYKGLLVQAVPLEADQLELCCANKDDVLAGNYEWKLIPNPADL